MPVPHLKPINDRSAWRGEDLARVPQEWTYRMSAIEIAELEAAAAAVKGRAISGLGQLRFHVDECDHSVLMCLRTAKSGGVSAVVSSAQVFNQLLATRPEALPKLFEGYVFSLMGEERPGVGPVSDHLIPIFSWFEEHPAPQLPLHAPPPHQLRGFRRA